MDLYVGIDMNTKCNIAEKLENEILYDDLF